MAIVKVFGIVPRGTTPKNLLAPIVDTEGSLALYETSYCHDSRLFTITLKIRGSFKRKILIALFAALENPTCVTRHGTTVSASVALPTSREEDERDREAAATVVQEYLLRETYTIEPPVLRPPPPMPDYQPDELQG